MPCGRPCVKNAAKPRVRFCMSICPPCWRRRRRRPPLRRRSRQLPPRSIGPTGAPAGDARKKPPQNRPTHKKASRSKERDAFCFLAEGQVLPHAKRSGQAGWAAETQGKTGPVPFIEQIRAGKGRTLAQARPAFPPDRSDSGNSSKNQQKLLPFDHLFVMVSTAQEKITWVFQRRRRKGYVQAAEGSSD